MLPWLAIKVRLGWLHTASGGLQIFDLLPASERQSDGQTLAVVNAIRLIVLSQC